MTNRPLVTFLLLTFNQENYILDALEGAASQDYPNLEIIISDDCSTDNTNDIINKFLSCYHNDHKIIYNRNDSNLGLIPHFNKAISLSHGDYIVLAAGDDISLPNRTSISVNAILETGAISLATNFKYIDSNGTPLNSLGFQTLKDPALYTINDYISLISVPPSGPSRIINRTIIDTFGPFLDDCPTEDTTLTLRALLLGCVAHTNTTCVLYRWHGQNISAPENLYHKIKPRKIYNQYYHDIKIAKSKNLINQKTFRNLKKTINDYLHYQIFIRKIYSEHNKYIRHLHCILYLINPHILPAHKKKSYLRQNCKDLFIIWDALHGKK